MNRIISGESVPQVRRRIKTAGHAWRNAFLRRLHDSGWSYRRLARYFLISSTRAWEIAHGQGAGIDFEKSRTRRPQRRRERRR